MLSIWTLGLIQGSAPLIFNQWKKGIPCRFALVFHKWYLVAIIAHVLAFLIITSVLYTNVFFTARKVQKEIHKQEKSFHKGIKNFRKQAQVFKMYGMVLGCFYLCYFPFLVTTLVKFFIHKPLSVYITAQICCSLVFMNSCANFMIYIWKSPDFKWAFARLFGCVDLKGYDDWMMSGNRINSRSSTSSSRSNKDSIRTNIKVPASSNTVTEA